MNCWKLFVVLAVSALPACMATTLEQPVRTDALSARQIVEAAHEAAGGETWVRPQSLHMSGYGLFWRNGEMTRHDRHEMWRVYPGAKTDAHVADGKVRIDSFKDDAPVFQISFDGQTTYTTDGPVEGSADSDRWKANFGFGVIRFALDEGYSLRREADDLVDGEPVYTIVVIDPAGGETLFAVDQQTSVLRKVGFDTPRGWHERIYSDFFVKPGIDWVQPGRVRLFYNGVKANEVIWTDFDVNSTMDDDLFVLGEGR